MIQWIWKSIGPLKCREKKKKKPKAKSFDTCQPAPTAQADMCRYFFSVALSTPFTEDVSNVANVSILLVDHLYNSKNSCLTDDRHA